MTASRWCKCTVTVKVGALSRSPDLRVSESDTGVKRVSARLISKESSWISGLDYTPLFFSLRAGIIGLEPSGASNISRLKTGGTKFVFLFQIKRR